jgi:hypothetical protein
MKTEKFYTKRKIDNGISAVIKNIRDFTYTELYDILSKSKDPLVYRISENEYVLGRYSVVNNANSWTVMTFLGDVEYSFYNKDAALLYTLMLMMDKFTLAAKIAANDTSVSYSKVEMDLYKEKIVSAIKTGDMFKQELYAVKHDNSKFKYVLAKKDLEKTLRLAKYLKLGT